MPGTDKTKLFKVALAFTVLVVLVLLPALFGSKLIITGDQDDLYYAIPIFDFYGDALKDGESFLWNPHLFSGFPTYLSQSAGFFDPLNIALFKTFSNLDAYYIRLAIGLILTLIFSYLTGIKFGISPVASFFIGISYLLAFHWRFLGNLLVSNTLFLLPFLLYVYKSFLESDKKGWMWVILGGIGIGWAFISGNAQFTIYSLTLLGLYSLIYYFYIQDDTKTFIRFLKISILPLLIITVIGFIIGLPQILPSLEFSSMTIRNQPLDYTSATHLTIMPGDISLLLFPDYSYFPYITEGRRPMHIGVLWFLLSITGMYYLFKNRLTEIKKRKEMIAMLILFLFSLLTSIKWSPIFYILNKLPIYGLFRDPARWMFFGTFFLSILGAYGFDSLKEYKENEFLKKTFKAYLFFIAFLSSIFVFLNFAGHFILLKLSLLINSIFSIILYDNFTFTKGNQYYLGAIERGLLAWKEFTSFGSPQFLIPFLAIIFSSILIYLFLWQRITWVKFKLSVVILVTLGFIGVFSAQWQVSMDKEVLSYNNMITNEIDVLNDHRVYTILMNSEFNKLIEPKFKLTNEELKLMKEFQFISGKPNMHIFSGASYIDGYDIFLPTEMKVALTLLGSENGAEDETRGMSLDDKKRALLKNLDILSMMSGKYVVSGEEIKDERLKKLNTVFATQHNLPLYIYENKEALPHYYLAHKVVGVQSAKFSDLIDGGYSNFIKETYIECDNNCKNFVSESDSITKVSIGNGNALFNTSTKNDRWLVFNESFLPGWYAEINGIPAEIRRANGFYMAVFVPDGKHEISFEYRGLNNELKILRLLGLVKN